MLSPALRILHDFITRIPDNRRSPFQEAILRELKDYPNLSDAVLAGYPGVFSSREDRLETWVTVAGDPGVETLVCDNDKCPNWPK